MPHRVEYGKGKSRHTPCPLIESVLLAVGLNGLTYNHDPLGLATGVPILDVERHGRPVVFDGITVSLFGEGTDSAGQPSYAARVVTLHAPEFLNHSPVPPDPTAIRDPERLERVSSPARRPLLSSLPKGQRGVYKTGSGWGRSEEDLSTAEWHGETDGQDDD